MLMSSEKLIERTEQPLGDIALIKLDKPVRNLPFVPIATQVGNLDGQAAQQQQAQSKGIW
jgi:hypothetical protein